MTRTADIACSCDCTGTYLLLYTLFYALFFLSLVVFEGDSVQGVRRVICWGRGMNPDHNFLDSEGTSFSPHQREACRETRKLLCDHISAAVEISCCDASQEIPKSA
jgi:hypothetical protein